MIHTNSREAYQNKKIESKETDYKKIVKALAILKKPSTYREIARCIGWFNPNKVSRRTKEMQGLKLIKAHESRICSIAKTKCSTYTAIAAN